MGATYTSLLYYCEEHLIPRAKFIQRIDELKVKIVIFVEENQNENANKFSDGI